jgi:hypothetical protein
MSYLRAIGAAALIAAAAVDSRAAFETTTLTPQAAAMGGSSLAGQADPATMFLNPAATAGLQNPEAYMMYDQLFAGLSGVGSIGEGFGAFGIPTKIGTVGIGFSDYEASGLLEDRVIGVSFARRLFGVVDAGITGKYLYQRYLIGSDPLAAADPVFSNGTSRGAFAFDLGLSAPLSDNLKAGLVVRNANQPNMGLASEDAVARQVQAGVSYDVKPAALLLTADYNYTAAQAGTLSQKSEPGVGLEKSFADGRVKFRVGATLDQFSGGIGLQLGAIGFDYTFLISRTLSANNAGTHMVGFRYRFGGTK